MDPILQQAQDQMHKAVSFLQQDLGSIRTGRAAPSLVENVVLTVYGGSAKMRVLELATIAATDAQTLTITPFDPSIVDEIHRGLLEANLGVNPSTDGKVIRITIPPLTQERRQELVKMMHQKLENARIMIRQARQDALQDVKKSDELSEDQQKYMEKEIQKYTDDFTSQIDALGKAKEADLMQL